MSHANNDQPNNPLHGITTAVILKYLILLYGWEKLHFLLPVNCFLSNPTYKSSLNFFRKTPWAKRKLEEIYLATIQKGIHADIMEKAIRLDNVK
jgi:uncharacterized protein (DUF2132 family)